MVADFPGSISPIATIIEDPIVLREATPGIC
jgi:hypothetical protein